MSKRQYMYPTTFLPSVTTHSMFHERLQAEKMCQKKLRKTSNMKTNLCQRVLVRNTLKYVQNCEYVTFACDDDSEYEPLHKIHFEYTSTEDIGDILNEIDFTRSMQPPEGLFLNWTESLRKEQNLSKVSDDYFTEPDDVLEYPSDIATI